MITKVIILAKVELLKIIYILNKLKLIIIKMKAPYNINNNISSSSHKIHLVLTLKKRIIRKYKKKIIKNMKDP
jgi:hypothetical protein